MSRRPLPSARSASSTPPTSPKVCPKTSLPQPRSRTTSWSMPRRWWAEGRLSERLGKAGAAGRRGAPAGRVVATTSHPVGLQPQLQQAQLPELVALERRQLAVRVGQQRLDVLLAEQPAVAGGLPAQGVAHHVEDLALQVRDRRDGEVALRPVDDLGGDDPAADRLEHALAAVGQLELRRARRASSTRSWSRNGTRASRPQAMDMLS